MNLSGVLFLAAFTARSQAYAKAMQDASLFPSHILLFGAERANLPGQKENNTLLSQLVASFEVSVIHHEELSVNDPAIIASVKKLNPRLIIYSGYGGQIVGKELLSLGPPVLHIHSGWLPDYRGSTTLYYSILNERSCATSAILLSPRIDEGTIVARKKYPLPTLAEDIDYVYDSSLRADLLKEVLTDWARQGEFSQMIPQKRGEGTTYYVIHPLLKHLAILSL